MNMVTGTLVTGLPIFSGKLHHMVNLRNKKNILKKKKTNYTITFSVSVKKIIQTSFTIPSVTCFCLKVDFIVRHQLVKIERAYF